MPLGDDISASACGDDGTPAHHGSNGNVRMNPITSAPPSMPTAKGEEFGVLFSTLSSGVCVASSHLSHK